MKIPRRRFLHLAVGAVALPAVSRIAGTQTYPAKPDYDVFALGDVALQSGITLPRAKLAYKTYGKLAATRDNAVLMPTYYGGRHNDNEAMIGAGRALDPARWFIIVPNMLGNGLSSSPSNTPLPFDRAGFPNVTLYDNVVCQHQLVTQKLEIDRLKLVVGFSMGAQQAFHWGALYPEMVQAIAPFPITTCFWTALKLHCWPMRLLRTVGIERHRSKACRPSAASMPDGRSPRIFFASENTARSDWRPWKTS
jgi:homoserine acetyltransferase